MTSLNQGLGIVVGTKSFNKTVGGWERRIARARHVESAQQFFGHGVDSYIHENSGQTDLTLQQMMFSFLDVNQVERKWVNCEPNDNWHHYA
jgi:hypothetical protein